MRNLVRQKGGGGGKEEPAAAPVRKRDAVPPGKHRAARSAYAAEHFKNLMASLLSTCPPSRRRT
jgi:hypothetical protein